MGRGAGPADAGDNMRFLALVMVIVLTACTHASVRMSTDGSTTTTTSSSVSVGYSGSGSAAMWVLIGIGLIAAEYGGSRAARVGRVGVREYPHRSAARCSGMGRGAGPAD